MSMSPEEKAEFLQIYLDETEEELDALTDTMLVLEENPNSTEDLNEAFRMVHSMKGAAGMMGFQGITAVTHLLESRFEKLRSGVLILDAPTMAITLRCVDYLRECNQQLRDDEEFESPEALLQDLQALAEQTIEPPEVEVSAPELSELELSEPELSNPEPTEPEQPASQPTTASVPKAPIESRAADVPPTNVAPATDASPSFGLSQFHVTVIFEGGLKLLDMKGQLIVTRLGEYGEVINTLPTVEELATRTGPVKFQLIMASDRTGHELHSAADVHGVTSVSVVETESSNLQPDEPSSPSLPNNQPAAGTPTTAIHGVDSTNPSSSETSSAVEGSSATGANSNSPGDLPQPVTRGTAKPNKQPVARTKPNQASETVRVEIDRLDHLLNLAGELVVNKARFSELANRMSPAFKQSNTSNQVRSLGDSLRSAIDSMHDSVESNGNGHLSTQLHGLAEELRTLEDQWAHWNESRKCFGQINEAIDQLSRVSDSLQRGVLQTRMVSVSPLFNRFKRVIRDLSLERKKKISLLIRGEKTELDKRMVDELGDPLVHLVRNSIDHGMESPEQRRKIGKPETGTITLEAAHSGNNVFIHIRDDGGGIQVASIRERIVERGLLSASAASELNHSQVIEYIWHPGFSTAAQVTNISGRGVGMDIVKTRIAELNGTIEVESTEGVGTTFTIRLPLTLAIINSLLFRIGQVVYGVPMDDVWEIVSLTPDQIVTVHGKQTFSVRGQYLPLVDVNDLFHWHNVGYNERNPSTVSSSLSDPLHSSDPNSDQENAESTSMFKREPMVNVVVLQSVGRAVGMRVDELLGGEDIVIKSLSENFVNIRGLSGASILGDGSVSLLLDVGTVLDMAVSSNHSIETS